MLFLRRTLPLIIAFVVGVIGTAIYYIPHSAAQNLENELAKRDRSSGWRGQPGRRQARCPGATGPDRNLR